MKIAFVWQGSSDRKTFDHWNDGLREAMRIIEKEHEVIYYEPWDYIEADFLLYWEAPCTIEGKNANNYISVRNLPMKKALLFAGGMIRRDWVEGFDLLFLESETNADDCDRLGIPYKMAFGINDEIFKPEHQPKIFDAIHQGTCASWKRQELFGEALGSRGVVCGRNQEADHMPFDVCRERGAMVLPELSYEAVNSLLNATHVMVQTSNEWGGGQRATLEALSAGIPVIVMTDSPKNMQFIEEGAPGLIVDPNVRDIRKAVDEIKTWSREKKMSGIDYVNNRWTAKHYADKLLKGIIELSV